MKERASEISSGDVVVQLMGGLGNQMFQYASGLALARAKSSKLWLDSRALPLLAQRKNLTPRKMEVCDFRVTSGIPTDQDFQSWGLDWRVLPPPVAWISGRWWRLAQRAVQSDMKHGIEIYSESSLDFDPKWSTLKEEDLGVYLRGFWQSENYFSEIRDHLVDEFVPSSELSPKLKGLRQRITEQQSLIVHVRRGDLVRNQKARNFHGLLPVAYYRSSIDKMVHVANSEAILVFSDDESWCQNNLGDIANLTIVQRSDYPGNSAQHLYAMSAGSAFVTANSSYSWWAAWLSGVSGDCIAAPDPWFAQGDASGPVPAHWSKIEF